MLDNSAVAVINFAYQMDIEDRVEAAQAMFGSHAILSHVRDNILCYVRDKQLPVSQATQVALDLASQNPIQLAVALWWRHETIQYIVSLNPDAFFVSSHHPVNSQPPPIPANFAAAYTRAQVLNQVVRPFCEGSAGVSVRLHARELQAEYRISRTIRSGDVSFRPGQDENAITMEEIPAGVNAYYLRHNGQPPRLYTMDTLEQLDLHYNEHAKDITRENPYTRQRFNYRQLRRALPL